MNRLQIVTMLILTGALYAGAETNNIPQGGARFSGEISRFVTTRQMTKMNYSFNAVCAGVLDTVFPKSDYGIIMVGDLWTSNTNSAPQQQKIFMAGFPNEGFAVGDKWEGIIYPCGETQDHLGQRLRIYTTSKATAVKIKTMVKTAKERDEKLRKEVEESEKRNKNARPTGIW